jgi:hypothetical protein
MRMRKTGRYTVIFIIASLAVIGMLATAAARTDREGLAPVASVPDLNITQNTPDMENLPAGIQTGPTPITLFRAELNQSELPGPRYMAFGPSVIGVSIDPRQLAIVFAAVFAGLTVWLVVLRKKPRGDDGKEE